jgi:hypothetical protein
MTGHREDGTHVEIAYVGLLPRDIEPLVSAVVASPELGSHPTAHTPFAAGSTGCQVSGLDICIVETA